jgi:hypothetical protein
MPKRRRGFDGEQDGSGIGVYSISQGAAWLDLTVANFDSVTQTALPTSGRMANVSIINLHGTQSLYLLLKPQSGEAVTQAIPIPAGQSFNVDCLRVADGAHVETISIRGSGAATTGRAVVTFVK